MRSRPTTGPELIRRPVQPLTPVPTPTPASPPPVGRFPQPVTIETQAMNECADAFDSLDLAQRLRVIRWLASRYELAGMLRSDNDRPDWNRG